MQLKYKRFTPALIGLYDPANYDKGHCLFQCLGKFAVFDRFAGTIPNYLISGNCQIERTI